jgi:multidrug efflux pump subunit AcrB
MGPYLKSLNWALNALEDLVVGPAGHSDADRLGFLATRLPFEFQPAADRGRAPFSRRTAAGRDADETDAIASA